MLKFSVLFFRGYYEYGQQFFLCTWFSILCPPCVSCECFLYEPVDPAEARRRRRDIRQGKRPIQDNPQKKIALSASLVCASSSIGNQRDLSTLLSSSFRPTSLQQPAHYSSTSGPSFISSFRPKVGAHSTPLVSLCHMFILCNLG